MSLEDIKKCVRIEAKERRNNAGYSGERHDYGASELLEKLKFYEMGERGEIPEEWKKYMKHLDPEYVEYKRLSKKFR